MAKGKSKMNVEEAGRKGGESTSESHRREFNQEIGRKGGESVSEDREHIPEIGRKGGKSSGGNR